MFDRIDEGRYWDEGWQLIDGCTPVSAGCAHCWSASMAHRFPRCKGMTTPGGAFNGKIRLNEHLLERPLHRRKPTAYAVWNDIGHVDVPAEFIRDLADVMHRCPQHVFMLLTKRPENLEPHFNNREWAKEHPNVWIGVTAENQEMADKRIPSLMRIEAAVRYVSIEPMLGPIMLPRGVRLTRDIYGDWPVGHDRIAPVGEYIAFSNPHGALCVATPNGSLGIKPFEFEDIPLGLHWVVLGGETGAGARIMQPNWVRSARDQCVQRGIPFLFKHWGGAKNTGRLLDEAEWDELPQGMKP
jgi:protein gp37